MRCEFRTLTAQIAQNFCLHKYLNYTIKYEEYSQNTVWILTLSTIICHEKEEYNTDRNKAAMSLNKYDFNYVTLQGHAVQAMLTRRYLARYYHIKYIFIHNYWINTTFSYIF